MSPAASRRFSIPVTDGAFTCRRDAISIGVTKVLRASQAVNGFQVVLNRRRNLIAHGVHCMV